MSHEQIVGIVGATVGVFVAVLTLGLARAPTCRGLKWAGLIAVAAAAMCAVQASAGTVGSDRAAAILEQISMALSGVLLWAWIQFEIPDEGNRGRRFGRAFGAGALVVAALSLVPVLFIGTRVIRHGDAWSGARYVDVLPTPVGALALGALFVGYAMLLVRYVDRWSRGDSTAGAHAIGLGGLLVTGVHDLLDGSALLHPGMHLVPLGLLWAVGSVGVALVGRFVQDARALSEVSARLEQVVEDRTAELASARATLVETQHLATLGRLSAAVAHEINNPVAVVAANLGYLRDSLASGATIVTDELEAIQDTLDSVDRISGIVRQLGEAGELAAGDGTSFAVALASTVNGAVAVARSRFEDAPSVLVDIATSIYVASQEASLRQALASLIATSLEALRDAGGQGTVRVHAERVGERVVIRIEDDAPELDDILRQRRFKPYFDTRPEVVRGDVGLSVSLALIRMLGAKVALERSDESGSVIRIDMRGAVAPSSRSDAPKSNRTPRARVLVVDDDVLTRIGLRRLLGREYVIEEVATVEEALALVQTGDDLDAIICDVVMPDGGAPALLAQLERENPRLANAVLLLTGGAIDATTGSFLANNAHRLVRKPVDVTTLRAMIEKVRIIRNRPIQSLHSKA